MAAGSRSGMPDAAQVVECPGGTIVPGVIDMHAHVGFMMTGPRTPHVEIADPPRHAWRAAFTIEAHRERVGEVRSWMRREA